MNTLSGPLTANLIIRELNRCAGEASSTYLFNQMQLSLAFEAFTRIVQALCEVELIKVVDEVVILLPKGKELAFRQDMGDALDQVNPTNEASINWIGGLEEGKRDLALKILELYHSAGDAEVGRVAVMQLCEDTLRQ